MKNTSIEIIVDDITKLQVDAIVNAANTSLLGGGGVDGAIHAAAGPELLQACQKIGGCPTGEARITSGFDLPAKWIIHTVGPVWQGGDSDETQLLSSAYRNVFSLAGEYEIQSIAFPAISTGVYAFPKDQAARIALENMVFFSKKFTRIVACCFSSSDADLYKVTLDSL